MELKKTYKYFNLETLDQVSEEKTITFEPAKDLAEAQARVGGDEGTLLKALNAFLRGEALKAAEREVTSKGGKKSVVLAIAKPFRALPPFSTMYVLDSEGRPVVKDGEKVVNRKAQTKAILEVIKSNPAMLDAIRAGSENDDDDSNDNDDNDE